MPYRKITVSLAGCILFAGAVFAEAVFADAKGDQPTLSYDRDVRPILSENCFSCHGFDEDARQADLRLDVYDVANESSGVLIAGEPQSSELVARLESSDPDALMPPPDSGKKLTPVQIQLLKQWISEGAKYESHWAFGVPQKAPLPPIDSAKHPIDKFVQQKLLDRKLQPSPPASLETLIRRVSLDLIGLPPKVEEIDSFVQQAEIDLERAYTDLVDRLLASPHYGERWGRWWLDQARYADSHGYSIDNPRDIWPFRDWVIESLNNDMPFDQFTIHQLAGDLLPEATDRERIATGFHRNTQINQEGGIDPEQFRIDSVFDRVATTGTVWLGLTIGCAQCHDHKFDPVSQEEFYRLFAFFNNQDEPTLTLYPPGVDANALKAKQAKLEKLIAKAFGQQSKAVTDWEQSLAPETIDSFPSKVREALSIPGDKRRPNHKLILLSASSLLPTDLLSPEDISRYDEITSVLDKATKTLVLEQRKEPRTTTVYIKGDFTRPSDEVSPGTPAVLHPFTPGDELPDRLDLANWIVDKENPLTSRVIVNRVWQQFFGLGLVETENDFGLQGTVPSHPELLDWLAVDWLEQGWSLKQLLRSIATSHVYRQSSNQQDVTRELDPLNVWLSRQNRLRLDAEIVRDSALFASGLLVPKQGGPPVYPPIPDGVMSQGQVKREWKVSKGSDRYRRGLYTFVFRNTPPPSLSVFDAPEGLSSCTRRMRSNTPLQALTLMNDAAFFEMALALKDIIDRDGIEKAFRRCTSRSPNEQELTVLSTLDSMTAARTLLNLDETITRE
jgi:hypothetical protein